MKNLLGLVDWHDSVVDNESDLLSNIASRAVQDLSGEVGSERNNLGSDERVSALVAGGVVQSRTVEESGQVERGQSVKNNDLVGGIGVDGLVEREVGRVAVKGPVKSGGGSRVGVGKTSNPFLEETFSLGSSDRRTWTVVVVERLFRMLVTGSSEECVVLLTRSK